MLVRKPSSFQVLAREPTLRQDVDSRAFGVGEVMRRVAVAAHVILLLLLVVARLLPRLLLLLLW